MIDFSNFSARLIFLAPLASLLLIILDRLVFHRAREVTIKRYVAISQLLALSACTVCAFTLLFYDFNELEVLRLSLMHMGSQSLLVLLKLDRLSLAFLWMTCFLGGIVGLFASRYLHKDSGFFRFFVLYHIFLLGMQFITLGANLPTIFIGWELVGLSSALLISFFSYRRQTVHSSLRAFWAYRITDCGLLVASLIAMHLGVDDLAGLSIKSSNFTSNMIVLACLFSAMGKSALFPFGHWLPKAMEGPTPSSAIFYGGLSVHAGLYLMLRISYTLGLSWQISLLLVILGLITMFYGSLVGRIQNDVKSTLAYAAMSQVGFMFIVLGLGFETLAILLFIGHALLRTYQLLNASNLIQERTAFDRVLGRHVGARAKLSNHAYALAFWESSGGLLTKLSLLDLVENCARIIAIFDRLLADFSLRIIRNILYYYMKILHLIRVHKLKQESLQELSK